MSKAIVTPKRKLIEVSLPLEAINRESSREKSIRHGHPSTLHLWWARRPLAACRAVLFAQLVDDPSAHPDRFPTEEDRVLERKRLFDLIERLVISENATDETLLREANDEIRRAFDGSPPPILDPFAGGGSIPLEAQRLGLEAHASDLNPVAVLINKALIEIPPKYAGLPPVFPGAVESRLGGWPRASGIAEDVRRYGQWVRNEAVKRVGHLYPKATLSDGTYLNSVAWIWARTVACPNPACGALIPLVSTWWLCKNKDRPTWVDPVVAGDQVRFAIRVGKSGPSQPTKRGRGANFACPACGTLADRDYVHDEFRAAKNGVTLLTTVAQGDRKRIYVEPCASHISAADIARPDVVPDQECRGTFGGNALGRRYGFDTFADYFTNRQLVTLTTISDLIQEVHARVKQDADSFGLEGEAGSRYADAVALYLAFALSKMADRGSSICSWVLQRESVRNTFTRQAIPMTWDFVEMNMLLTGAGTFSGAVDWTVESIGGIPATRNAVSDVIQADAASRSYPNRAPIVTTDPPYYDNIGYADLSDFFYVWLRRTIGPFYPDVTSTMLTPKSEELIAAPHRFYGDKKLANQHFEDGFIRTFTNIRKNQSTEAPTVIFYAFKQSETDGTDTVSTGWETMLNGLMEAGFAVTATWPMRTEREDRSTGLGTNALASSIVLACRPREVLAAATTRRGFLAALKAELPQSLKDMQQGSLAPVDLAQAAIGPGMSVFSRYARVVEADGSDMRVRTALALINHALDEVLSEQEGDFDSDTRFCVKWFGQFGFNEASFGDADQLSRSTNTSVDGLVRGGIFWARAGRARLLSPEMLSEAWDPVADDRISVWEVAIRLAKAVAEQGVDAAASLYIGSGTRVDLDAAKELSYLLFSICERKGWTQTALLFNGLGSSWLDLEHAARGAARVIRGTQDAFDYTDNQD